MVNNDKQKLLYLLKILWTHTDRQHFLNSQNLIRILQDDYQCSCDRRTFYSNIDALIHAGFNIKQVKGNTHGYYMEERIFSFRELKLLVDAVQSSKFIKEERQIKSSTLYIESNRRTYGVLYYQLNNRSSVFKRRRYRAK